MIARGIFFALLLIFALAIAGCNQPGSGDSVGNTSSSSEVANTSEVIEKKIMTSLLPYDGFTYKSVNITCDGSTIDVVATSPELDGTDIYRFVYDNGTLILKSYCLEALPLSLKEKAIAIAMSDERVRNQNPSGEVTVRRVLPETASKFYQPKELFSVTWHGETIVSALVDVEEEIVVSVWNSRSSD
ncbi:hypothetical protein [Archaeoglobus veneficus]|uniref:Lipoprotein n=1 Tax=Archaeoglobus veneficus (strain DSM 11195 / SNP6) TaxID=693661 RepID=F2KRC6_ARCVS|nr:hypothetical protein [Archaeoglobus veneficus]AEA47860.1 hypothetical protein Arcve_1866 [Archaeoglobus veneficus SNP6]